METQRPWRKQLNVFRHYMVKPQSHQIWKLHKYVEQVQFKLH